MVPRARFPRGGCVLAPGAARPGAAPHGVPRAIRRDGGLRSEGFGWRLRGNGSRVGRRSYVVPQREHCTVVVSMVLQAVGPKPHRSACSRGEAQCAQASEKALLRHAKRSPAGKAAPLHGKADPGAARTGDNTAQGMASHAHTRAACRSTQAQPRTQPGMEGQECRTSKRKTALR